MQKNNVNIVVFDENQSFMTEQSHMNYNGYRRATTNDVYGTNQPQSIISNQINSLNEKINNLQEKAERIQEYIKTSNANNTSQMTINTNTNANAGGSSTQIQQLLRVVELKIQIVVQQTKKIIQRMTSQFDRKLSRTTSQKNHQVNSISKIQSHCRDTIAKIQQGYQEQLNMIKNQHLHLQKRLIQKVEQIENDYKNKLKEFKSKEQEYLTTIQQLQSKLRVSSSNLSNITNKSKKLIEVTQDKPSSSQKSQYNDNMSSMSSQQFASSQGINPNDTSRRRTKIFQSKSSNKSKSPSNAVLSPLKSQNNIKTDAQMQSYQTSKPKIPQLGKKSKPSQTIDLSNTVYPKQSLNNNFVSQAKNAYHNLQVRATVVPEQNSIKQALPRSLTQKGQRGQQQNSLKELRRQPSREQNRQFPKVQWQRFQDFNDEENSGQQQDVFFYPEHNKILQEPKSVFDYQSNTSNIQQSMHSPFDLQ